MLKSVKLNLFLFLATLGTISMSAQTEAKKVTDQDLNKFADAYQAVQMENQKAQQEMVAMIEESGLDVEKFQKIQKAQMDPNTEVEATEKELTAHKQVMAEIQAMQPKLQSEMEALIKKKGLTMQRYQEVAAAIQTNQELQQQLQAIMMKKQTGDTEG
ncbi:DUF4168 domain-containing protein [Mesonia mobilis]|uniref:DUF4168 domain-containing protein n=1 Tax=Mesonia mobilis TaxID=369791 RepID=A0ABQ3BPW5_9FLAO|nr:DUF4168 domain-containing protein [Mesonia mobilis]MBQ0738282.1 DUF4168 domain-containing protein [Aquimarina celericrescens]GGZ51042.1 hypothetical protein GCM10008088_11080 [Mesonia mobilis]